VAKFAERAPAGKPPAWEAVGESLKFFKIICNNFGTFRVLYSRHEKGGFMERLVSVEKIESKIFQIRGKKVMLDMDLAKLYAVETKVLNQAVKRNLRRFPSDFMFVLSKEEIVRMSQFVTSLKFHKRVTVFTEQGVAMLSSVLNSERAILVNIQVMRAFVNIRRIAITYVGLGRRIEEMEKKYDTQFRIVFEAIKKLLEPLPEKPKRRIGFHVD